MFKRKIILSAFMSLWCRFYYVLLLCISEANYFLHYILRFISNVLSRAKDKNKVILALRLH